MDQQIGAKSRTIIAVLFGGPAVIHGKSVRRLKAVRLLVNWLGAQGGYGRFQIFWLDRCQVPAATERFRKGHSWRPIRTWASTYCQLPGPAHMPRPHRTHCADCRDRAGANSAQA